MKLLTLDLSLHCVGWAMFSSDGKLMKKGRIMPSSDISNPMKIHYLSNKIKELFTDIEELVVEDIYYGCNFDSVVLLAKIGGAVVNTWMDYKYRDPILYVASHARVLSGIKGNSHKAEVQLYVIKKYEYTTKDKIYEYETDIEELKNQKKKLTSGQYKYRMEKISEKIDKETNIGEDVADSIILGLAYFNDKENK